MTAMAVVFIGTTANAQEVAIKCSDNVQRGTLVLTNPPTMNCDDFNLVKGYVGSGITVGPDSRLTEILSAVRKIQPAPDAKPVTPVTVGNFDVTENNLKLEDSGVNIRREDSFGQRPLPRENIGDLDDFSRKTFPGQNRTGNRKWFSELESTKCQGWINLNDILSGKCGSVQVNMNR